jgi:hypothetical protein
VWQYAPPELMRREARGEPSGKLALLRGLGRFEQVLGGYGRYQDALRLPARIKNQELYVASPARPERLVRAFFQAPE